MPIVALLGTGIMGSAMARNLLKHGIRVRVWNRTQARAEPLRADGAQVAASPAEAVDGADVVITMLADGPAVLSAMRDAPDGLRAGQVWAQMSTVSLTDLESLAALAAEHGLTFVDAPVQGTRQPAEQGALLVLAAGPEAARPALEPVFEAVGQRTLWVGEHAGAAMRLKLAAVGYAISLTTVIAEALSLVEGLGVDPALFREVVSGGPLDSGYLQAKMRAILDGDYTTSFSVRNAGKDVQMITEAAAAAGLRLDVAAAAGERFRRAEAAGHGEQDMAATYFASFTG
ncbi:3-hydroxyisobutyrate dehydrogenase [Thermomonospora echinospora]|uniref:3-hydroxyisobutyrate dehydrogenase n=1 Tax=Thermomonospora echinospora TaxID=1992 RepID=A0A1H6E4G0_9ACTN|nr:NAD(P)-dependent oxidoreductase [Thermomonospora echinospora]SEG92532.1 3-hydroxyisobutyrate dehydrogenase [Thermomonospora echinospora]